MFRTFSDVCYFLDNNRIVFIILLFASFVSVFVGMGIVFRYWDILTDNANSVEPKKTLEDYIVVTEKYIYGLFVLGKINQSQRDSWNYKMEQEKGWIMGNQNANEEEVQERQYDLNSFVIDLVGRV